MKVYVLKDSVDHNHEFLKAKTVCEIDPKKDAAILGIGNVEEYDEEKHGTIDSKKSSDEELLQLVEDTETKLKAAEAKLKAAKAEIEELKDASTDDRVKALEEANAKLKTWLDESITLSKGKLPEGYEG